jgi:hypothetical protein
VMLWGGQRSGTRARGGSRQAGQGIMDVLGSMFSGHACSAEVGGGGQRIGEESGTSPSGGER